MELYILMSNKAPQSPGLTCQASEERNQKPGCDSRSSRESASPQLVEGIAATNLACQHWTSQRARAQSAITFARVRLAVDTNCAHLEPLLDRASHVGGSHCKQAMSTELGETCVLLQRFIGRRGERETPGAKTRAHSLF